MTFLKEKKLAVIFFFACFIGAIRVFSELAFLSYDFESHLYQNLRFYLENQYYFLITLFTVPLLVSRFTRENYPPLLSLAAKLFPLIILAPWVDHFLAGRTAGYENAEVTPGILLQVVLIIGSVIVYTFLKSKNIFRSLAAGFCTYMMLWFFAMPEFIFSPALNFASDTFLQFYYFIPFLIGAMVFLKWNAPLSFDALKKNLRLSKLLVGVVLAVAGALMIDYTGLRVHQVHVIHAAILFFLLCSIPEDGLPLEASIVISFVSLSYAFTLGIEAFYLSIAGLELAFSGKVLPPFLRKIRGGIVASLCYFIALYASAYVHFSIDAVLLAGGIFFLIAGAVLLGL